MPVAACALMLALSTLLYSCFREESPEPVQRVAVGDRLPALSLTLDDGSTVTNEDFNGKAVLIALFSVKCGDCRKELPEVERLYRALHDRDDVLIIGISRAEGEDLVAPFWEELSLTFPYSAQQDDKVYRKFADSVVPRIFIADRQGRVVACFDDTNMPSAELLLKVVGSV